MESAETARIASQELISNCSPIFNRVFQTLQRDWGEERILVCASKKYTMKLLSIRAHHGGGLQYHRMKDEAGYIVSGKIRISYTEDGMLHERILNPGDHFHFPPGCIHQEYALEDTLILEASTPHMNDRVRVESHFGLEEISSLPTTETEDIREL